MCCSVYVCMCQDIFRPLKLHLLIVLCQREVVERSNHLHLHIILRSMITLQFYIKMLSSTNKHLQQVLSVQLCPLTAELSGDTDN